MIERLIAWCARRRWMVITLVVLATLLGVRAVGRVPLDAIPDLSDVQVSVFTEWPGRSPDLVEDQITYPVVSSLLSAPKVQFVRGQSFFGLSFVYVIFEDGTDIYWARSRVLEYLQGMTGNLPEGVNPALGPDATGVGWVFEYALVDRSGKHDLQMLRSYQDWTLRYALSSVEGVAEVASVGGFVKQYQVELDPNALLAHGIPIPKVIHAIRRSNQDVGGRTVEWTGTEYMVRGRGYIRSVADLEEVAVGVSPEGTPILLSNLGRVSVGPEMRRGLVELDGEGEVVGGVVVMRYGENALRVIDRVKRRIEELRPAFPEGVELVVTYDRSDLIRRAMETLRRKLREEMTVVALVILLFLGHLRSALIPIFTLPIAVILAFLPMQAMGLTSNIMSLGGIAIAIGAMVDASIVLIENAHKRIERWKQEGRREPYEQVLVRSAQEVGRPIFFSLLVIAVSFIPIFALEGQAGRLFKPLAFTKNYAMAFAAVLAVTLAPALMSLLIRERIWRFRPRGLSRALTFLAGGEIVPEGKNPLSRFLFRVYGPVVDWVLAHRGLVVTLATVLVLTTVPVARRLGTEFVPPLWEGSFLYMPTALPGMSVTEAGKVLHVQNKLLKTFPEVERVFGKAGRAETSTDPAPLSMMETVVTLKPPDQWRPGMTIEKLKSEMNEKLQFPGMPNIFWMPIQTRIEMMTTGIRSPVGIKVLGPDLTTLQRIATEIEGVVQQVPGTASAFSERVTGGYFVDFEVRRGEAARYGLNVLDVEETVETAIGGMNVTQTVEGRERYPINVRYPRELRDDLEELKRALVPTPAGAQIPIGQLADVRITQGPMMIRDEDGMLSAFVFVDIAGRDLGRYVEEARAVVAEQVKIPPGYRLEWAGQYRHLERAREQLKFILPVTAFLILFLLYLNTGSMVKTGIVLLAVPFSLVGAVWILWVLNFNVSIAVWVGIIALAGVDAETGVIMLLYLDLAYEEWKKNGKLRTLQDLEAAVHHGAVQRIRPKLMTVGTTFFGLLPILWAGSHEIGADVMQRIAAPMVGGILTSFVGELLVYPAVYTIWKWRFEMKQGKADWVVKQAGG